MNNTLFGLSSRSKQVLSLLLRETEPISAGDIASRLQLSNSQVRYSVNRIENCLKGKNISIVKKPRSGMLIDISKPQKEALLGEVIKLEPNQISLQKEERYKLIILRLLVAQDPLSREILSQDLGISRTSLYRDLEQVRKWFKTRNIILVSSKRPELNIQGSEISIRETLVELLLNNLNQELLVEACVFPAPPSLESSAANPPFVQEAFEFVASLNLFQIETLINTFEKHSQILYVDRAHIFLALFIGILRYRFSNGLVLKPTDQDLDDPSMREEGIANHEFQHKLEALIGESLPPAELNSIDEAFCRAKQIGIAKGDSKPAQNGSNKELAIRLVREAAKYLHAGLLHDQELINRLELVLDSVSNSQEMKTSPVFSNPNNHESPADSFVGFSIRLLSPIFESYGYPLNIAVLENCVAHINTALNKLGKSLPQRKVWVICGAGLATAQNLVSRINLNLPGLQVLGVASVFELARNIKMTTGADAVISTVQLKGLLPIPLIHVTPLLNQDDIALIRETLGLDIYETSKQIRRTSTVGVSLAEMIDPNAIAINVLVPDWEAAVDKAGELLYQVGAIWPSYIEAMKDMIRLYGPYVVVAPNVALLHAGSEMGAKHLSMSLLTLKESVPFGHEVNDPVNIVLAFSSVDKTTHAFAIERTMELLEKKEFHRKLLKANSPDKVMEIISNVS